MSRQEPASPPPHQEPSPPHHESHLHQESPPADSLKSTPRKRALPPISPQPHSQSLNSPTKRPEVVYMTKNDLELFAKSICQEVMSLVKEPPTGARMMLQDPDNLQISEDNPLDLPQILAAYRLPLSNSEKIKDTGSLPLSDFSGDLCSPRSRKEISQNTEASDKKVTGGEGCAICYCMRKGCSPDCSLRRLLPHTSKQDRITYKPLIKFFPRDKLKELVEAYKSFEERQIFCSNLCRIVRDFQKRGSEGPYWATNLLKKKIEAALNIENPGKEVLTDMLKDLEETGPTEARD